MQNYNLACFLYGCENWSSKLREERRLRVIKMDCCGEFLGLRGTRWQGNGEDYKMKSLMICIPHEVLFGWSNQKNELGGACDRYRG